MNIMSSRWIKPPRKVHNRAFRNSLNGGLSVFERAEYCHHTDVNLVVVRKYVNLIGVVVMTLCFPASLAVRGWKGAVGHYKNRETGILLVRAPESAYYLLTSEC